MGSCLPDSCCLKHRCNGWNYSSYLSKIRQAWEKVEENCLTTDLMIKQPLNWYQELTTTDFLWLEKTPEFRKNFCNSMLFIKIDKTKNVVKKKIVHHREAESTLSGCLRLRGEWNGELRCNGYKFWVMRDG